MLYPLVFHPIYKGHLWGGRNLETLYGRKLPSGALFGESWEISDRPEGVSVVANGPLAGKDLHWLMENHAADLLGSAQAQNGRFPLLVKILDCKQAPSVQVHPPADAADRLGGEPKTEIWYVTQAGPDAQLKVGLRRGVKRGLLERKLGEGDMVGCLHNIPVRAGDAMFVPSGRVHAIGAGIVLFEIQQNSNTTYRLFDWNRLGPDGKPRELQVAQALAAMDFDDIEPDLVRSPFEGTEPAVNRKLADTPWFGVEEWRLQGAHRRNLGALDRPLILGLATGSLTVTAAGETVTLEAGQFCLIPASVSDAVVETKSGASYLVSAPGAEAKEDLRSEVFQGAAATGIPPWETRHARRSEGTGRRSGGPGGHRHKGLPSRRKLKHSLSSRLMYSPFLKMLVLFFWFRMAVLAFLLIGLTAAVMLPRVWTTTPAGFIPVVKVSLLDKLQVFMLRRGAVKTMGRGDAEAALQSWRNAFANNMGDPELARGVLRSTLAVDPITSKNLGSAFQTSEWLLRLTQTNRADLELVCEVYDKAQLYELVAAQLKPIADSLSGSLKTIYVKTLFFLSELQQYNELWNELSPSEQVRPDMALIRAGYLAGWGEVGVVAEAQAALNKAAEERGPLWLLANRLQMAISALRLDPERYAESLRRLQETQMDAGVEHAAYWSLLASSGRKAEAVRLAREFATPPRNPSELARLAEVNVQLGLKEEGLKLMRAFANYFPLSEPVWTIYAQMLLDAQDWEGLRGAALHMRQFAAFRGQLDALSHFYEGRADLGSGRVEAARQAFEKASEAEFRTPGQSILAASSLLGLGYPAQARAILERAEGMVTNRLQYLDLMSRAAILTKDGPLLLTTGQAAYELQPANVEYANRYAAGLLIQAERPAEAVRLTLELTTKFPNSETFRINHALALLLNRRPEEAEKALGRVSFGHLRPDELNAYYQAMFELKFQQRDYSQAWQNLDRLDWNQLFPNETNRLGQMRALLPPRSVSAPAPSA